MIFPSDSDFPATPTLKLKIKLPKSSAATAATANNTPAPNRGIRSLGASPALAPSKAPVNKQLSKIKLKTRLSLDGSSPKLTLNTFGGLPSSPAVSRPTSSPRRKKDAGPRLGDPTLSKKMRESLALNQPETDTSEEVWHNKSQTLCLYCMFFFQLAIENKC